MGNQVQNVLDNIFAEVNATNIRKSFYKRKDLIPSYVPDNEVNSGLVKDDEESKKPIYDSHGEELMEHTSKNSMNEMILANAKQANK